MSHQLELVEVPQCDSLARVRAGVEFLHQDKPPTTPLSILWGVSQREVSYALEAARILGLLSHTRGQWSGTSSAGELLACEAGSPEEREFFLNCIAETPLGSLERSLWDETLPPPSTETLAKAIQESTGLAVSTSRRRASTLLTWRRTLLPADSLLGRAQAPDPRAKPDPKEREADDATAESTPPALEDPTYRSLGFAWTPESLPRAVANLLRSNNYEVTGPIQVNGAEVDLRAQSMADPFAAPIFIEVTVEYVDNTKYGKDLTKLEMLRTVYPECHRMIVSSAGYTAPVRERATASRISVLTYEELRVKFEQFSPYLRDILEDGVIAQELAKLNGIYEEAHFRDSHGNEMATEWLTKWRDLPDTKGRWMIVVGEYGTGKTALSKVLLYRWALEHARDASLPIPLRIELRDFTHQFNATSLLSHVLRISRLGHVSVDFMESLIQSGRIVLLLDGYDEMAQYMHSRERRACLEALAQLSARGARGILTSRPNYFSEAEELQLIDVLYRDLQQAPEASASSIDMVLRQERALDNLLETHFLQRRERALRDLTPEQTRNLVRRILDDDAEGQRVIIDILDRVFRSSDDSSRVSLGGKPVIITYLLQVLESLRADPSRATTFSEWTVYDLIVTRLMQRDWDRTPVILSVVRRLFLRHLAAHLSQRAHSAVDEQGFKELIKRFFHADIARKAPDERAAEVERLFADLRSSATLTTHDAEGRRRWRFSHNSLREFLAAENALEHLRKGTLIDSFAVSDAMRQFAAARPHQDTASSATALGNLLHTPHRAAAGSALELLFDALTSNSSPNEVVGPQLNAVIGVPAHLEDLSLTRVTLSTSASPASLSGAEFRRAVLSDCHFDNADLRSAAFDDAFISTTTMRSCSLQDANFDSSVLLSVDFSDAVLTNTSFRGMDIDAIEIRAEGRHASALGTDLKGASALGYLALRGALVDELPIKHVLIHDERYSIFEKICRRLSENHTSQRRGLEQRGAARRDPEFGRKFVDFLIAAGLVAATSGRRDQVQPIDAGRAALQSALEDDIPELLRGFLLREILGGAG